jgi:glycine/D-amino acid oxidase-like deaminating enzyme
MPAPLLLIETLETLPPAADVVVIGGGIVGACAAYYLARRGVKVALVEKGRIGAEQSSRNWGWCRQQNRDARELPMATTSLALWEAMQKEIGEQRRLPPHRAALSLQRRGRDRRLGALARLRPQPRRRHPHAVGGGGDRARPRDGQALEGRRLLPHRRHRRSRARRPGDRPRGDATRRQRAPVLRRPRPRARGRPRRRRRHRGGGHPHPHRHARRRGLGLVVLPPARHPLPAGHGARLDPRGRPGRRGARRAPYRPGSR